MLLEIRNIILGSWLKLYLVIFSHIHIIFCFVALILKKKKKSFPRMC